LTAFVGGIHTGGGGNCLGDCCIITGGPPVLPPAPVPPFPPVFVFGVLVGFVLPFLTVCEAVLSLAVEVYEVEPLLEFFSFVFAFTTVKKEDVKVPSIINIITAAKNIVPTSTTIVFIITPIRKIQYKKEFLVILF
jgi:hypothetical protein